MRFNKVEVFFVLYSVGKTQSIQMIDLMPENSRYISSMLFDLFLTLSIKRLYGNKFWTRNNTGYIPG
jgi:hypothetical protein